MDPDPEPQHWLIGKIRRKIHLGWQREKSRQLTDMKCADRQADRDEDSRQDMQPGGRRRYGQEIMATGRKSRDEDRGK